MTAVRRLLPTVFVLSLSACATETAWVPAPARVSGTEVPGVGYTIRPAAPLGTVRVATLGTRDVEVGGHDRTLLVVRMDLDNRGSAPWRFDVASQLLLLEGGLRVQPDLVYSSTQGGPPVLDIPSSRRVTVDLLFPLPPHVEHPARVTFAWSVDTPGARVSETATFDVVEIDPGYAAGVQAPVFYSGLYYDLPFYPFYLSPFYLGSPYFQRPFYAPLYYQSYYGNRYRGGVVLPSPGFRGGGFGGGFSAPRVVPAPRAMPAPSPRR